LKKVILAYFIMLQLWRVGEVLFYFNKVKYIVKIFNFQKKLWR